MNSEPMTAKAVTVTGENRINFSRPVARRRSRSSAVTLVEVMIATVLFSITSISISALFVQNNQMAMRMRYRTNATNAALNVLEQIRVLEFDTLNQVYTNSAPAAVTNAYVRVIMADPNAPDNTALAAPDPTVAPFGVGADKVPLRYRYLDLVFNIRDTVIKNTTWNTIDVPLETAANAAKLRMRFWLTLKYNTAVSGDTAITAAGQVFEIALVYQWQQPGKPAASAWESGTIRAVVPNLNPQATNL